MIKKLEKWIKIDILCTTGVQYEPVIISNLTVQSDLNSLPLVPFWVAYVNKNEFRTYFYSHEVSEGRQLKDESFYLHYAKDYQDSEKSKVRVEVSENRAFWGKNWNQRKDEDECKAEMEWSFTSFDWQFCFLFLDSA